MALSTLHTTAGSAQAEPFGRSPRKHIPPLIQSADHHLMSIPLPQPPAPKMVVDHAAPLENRPTTLPTLRPATIQ
eukprot:10158142-Alexandrium_andersonii.AAC.1